MDLTAAMVKKLRDLTGAGMMVCKAALTEAELFATFDGPARAIRCARAILESAARFRLPARAGLQSGSLRFAG